MDYSSLLSKPVGAVAVISASALTGASMGQSFLAMPTIMHPSIPISRSAFHNSYMLRIAHAFFMPFNSLSMYSNVLLSGLSIYRLSLVAGARSMPLLSVLRLASPGLLALAGTAFTVVLMLPINARISALSDEIHAGDKAETPVANSSQAAEVRTLQRRWVARNHYRCVVLGVTALASYITSLSLSELLRE